MATPISTRSRSGGSTESWGRAGDRGAPRRHHDELTRHLEDGAIERRVAEINDALAADGKELFRWKTVPQGAATSVWAGVVAEAEAVGGRYCENCHMSELVEADTVSPVSEGVRPYALDAERAQALWATSEEMVGERF